MIPSYYDELKEFIELYNYMIQVKDSWLKNPETFISNDTNTDVYNKLYCKFFQTEYSPLNNCSIYSRLYQIYPFTWKTNTRVMKVLINEYFETLEKVVKEIKQILAESTDGVHI